MLQLKERLQRGSHSDPFVAKARVYVAMLDNPGSSPDPTPDAPDPDDFNNPTNRPGRQAPCQHHDLPTFACCSTLAVRSNDATGTLCSAGRCGSRRASLSLCWRWRSPSRTTTSSWRTISGVHRTPYLVRQLLLAYASLLLGLSSMTMRLCWISLNTGRKQLCVLCCHKCREILIRNAGLGTCCAISANPCLGTACAICFSAV
jgi:hypothetical protein